MSEAVEPKRLSGPLLFGMLALPPVFVWFLLRKGYAASTRMAGFVYAATMLGVGLLGSRGL